MGSNRVASAPARREGRTMDQGGWPESVSAGPSAGWGRRRRRLETPATFPPRVTLRSGWATALRLPTPHPRPCVFWCRGPGLLSEGGGGSRPRGAPSWNPGQPGDWNRPGGRGPAGEREGAPCEGGCLGGGGEWGSSALPP